MKRLWKKRTGKEKFYANSITGIFYGNSFFCQNVRILYLFLILQHSLIKCRPVRVEVIFLFLVMHWSLWDSIYIDLIMWFTDVIIDLPLGQCKGSSCGTLKHCIFWYILLEEIMMSKRDEWLLFYSFQHCYLIID